MSTLKAVFFDLDDTLVPTSVYDVRAYADAENQRTRLGLEKKNSSPLDVDKLVADFQREIRQSTVGSRV